MRFGDAHAVRVLGLIASLGLLTACSFSVTRPETPPGPGVPHIANLRFEPDVIRDGETTRMSFYFEVGSADIQEAHLVERGINQFQFYQSLQSISVDLRTYTGQVAGTVEVPLRWPGVGIRWIEVYVVTQNGNTSNRISARLTVR